MKIERSMLKIVSGEEMDYWVEFDSGYGKFTSDKTNNKQIAWDLAEQLDQLVLTEYNVIYDRGNDYGVNNFELSLIVYAPRLNIIVNNEIILWYGLRYDHSGGAKYDILSLKVMRNNLIGFIK